MDKRVIFIGGCPRSGTTMLGSIIGSTKNCIVTPESHFKQKIFAGFGAEWSKGIKREKIIEAFAKNFRFKIWGISSSDISLPNILWKHEYGNLIFNLVNSYAIKMGKPYWNVWIDHTPQNFQNALMLLEIFPNARFIHIIRDPRAIAASIMPLDWGPNTAEDSAKFWVQKITYGLAFESAFPEKCFKVKYEDILLEPEKKIKEICDFADIEFQDSMLFGQEFAVPDYSKKQHALIGKALNPGRISAWKKDLTELQVYQIEKSLEDLPGMMGYDKTGVYPITESILNRVVSKIKAKIKNITKRNRYSNKKRLYGKQATKN